MVIRFWRAMRITTPVSALALVIMWAPLAGAAYSDRVDQNIRVVCRDTVNDREAIAKLSAAVVSAVSALPPERSSSEDVEAAILYVLSQQNACPSVIDAVLAGLREGGSASFRQAVVRVSNARLSHGTGTAGIISSGNNSDTGSYGAFFSQMIVGAGGGSATYS
jgi:hypothetical protein